ncbi:MAG TPA: hypothetical protein VFE47_12145 [Tepidisphaeraceae bacterium]|jgi:hypothetical protein|nr:hypothetical protein [Tepidisphaeraceae bacterium]
MHLSNGTDGNGNFQPRKRIGLSNSDERRLRQLLRQKSPSEPWVEAQFVEICEKDSRGELVVRRMHDPAKFPPGGNRTKMVRCKICGILTPPNAMEDGSCLDHREVADWGQSPSAEAIRRIQFYFLKLTPLEMEPESTEALVQEIERHAGNRPTRHP